MALAEIQSSGRGEGNHYDEHASAACAGMPRRRVVVTGIGVVTPFGHDVESFWQALLAGRSCIAPITRLDTSDFPVHFGGQVADVTATPFLPASLIRRNDLSTNIGLLAGGLALESAGLGALAEQRRAISVMVGSAFGAMQGLQDVYDAFYLHGWRKMHPLSVPRNMFNSLSSNLSIHFKLGGSHHTVGAACASGAVAIGEAFRRIRDGEDAVVLAGGADAPICGSVLAGWAHLRVLSQRTEPAQASRPFDRERDGLVLSEGAGMLVLEDLEHARERGARSWGEIVGYGTSSDASHLTAPESSGQCEAILRALRSARLRPEDVDYVNAHGTSTRLNDETETQALHSAFGDRAASLAVSANKSMLGHTMGASGALELVSTLLTLRDDVIPPTINYQNPDPACDLDYVPNQSRRRSVRLAIKNSFAFGGENAVLVVRKSEELPQ
ncbi:MAG: beta-ketoacyl-[acyl-carrier-protein] synthase family protein [Polyangia bacterium]|jgi:3-oxoacyl-[acyl-carrier-protein] synthase II